MRSCSHVTAAAMLLVMLVLAALCPVRGYEYLMEEHTGYKDPCKAGKWPRRDRTSLSHPPPD